jgi:outer membrane protein OmpA-like peptidoglycan-associated protein
LKDGKWQKPQNLGKPVNDIYDETIDNVSLDGTILLMSGDFAGTYGEFDIYIAEKDSDSWKLSHLPYPINSKYHEESANLTSDGKALLFTSDRPGGIGPYIPINQYFYHGSTMGNMDIYISFLSDSGWMKPINLGNTINTPYSERSAYLHPDGKTLYFSSNGHAGLGKLDVYKTVRLKDDSWTEWSEPLNLGKEINTANDDWGYNIDIKGDSAFFGINDALDGYGNWDIYSVSLPKTAKPEKIIIVRGKVTDSKGNPLACVIKWEDLETGEVIGRLRSDPRDGNYFIVLNPGRNYGYFAEKPGFYPVSKNIDLKNKFNDKEIREDIILISLNELKNKNSVIINNIFFDYDKYELKSESTPELKRLTEFLIKNSKLKVIIEGHTDETGSNEYNLKLSENRADAIKKYLFDNGIKEDRITIKGYGKTKPIASNDTEENRARNRRVEIRFE